MPESFLDRTMRWMKHDVQVCMDNAANVGAMTLMMSDIAALAGFYVGRTSDRPDNDEVEFMKFFNNYFTKFNSDLARDSLREIKNGKEREMIYTHFRCGLIHEHLMKYGTAIDKGDKPYIFISEAGITLNIEIFHADYVESLDSYCEDVKSNNNGLGDNFEKRSVFLGAFAPHI